MPNDVDFSLLKNQENRNYSTESRRDDVNSFLEFNVCGNEIWKEDPVSSKEFFERYLDEPCFPEQQAFIDKVIGDNPREWNIRYTEAIAMIGKGGGKDRTVSKLLLYLCYRLVILKRRTKVF